VSTEAVVIPTLEVAHPSGVEIRYFAQDKEAKVKRHYEVRMDPSKPAIWPGQEYQPDWREVPSVTTIGKILHKEELIGWAERMGSWGITQLFNMGVVYPGEYNGQRVLATTDREKGHVLVGEWESVDLVRRYHVGRDSVLRAGGERGQSVHDALEAWAQTGMMPNPATYPLTEQGYVQGLVSFLTESGAEARASEVLVASIEDGWAGRYDVDLWLPRTVELWTHLTEKGRGNTRTPFETGLYKADLKTSKGAFTEHGEQLEAYEKGAVEDGLEATLQRCVIWVSKDGQYKFVPVGSGEPKIKQFAWSTYEDFRLTLAKYKAIQEREARRKHGH